MNCVSRGSAPDLAVTEEEALHLLKLHNLDVVVLWAAVRLERWLASFRSDQMGESSHGSDHLRQPSIVQIWRLKP